MHPILDALDGTPHDWIKKLLFTFNEGNIGKFEALSPVFPQEVGDARHSHAVADGANGGGARSRSCRRTTRSYGKRSVSWR